MVLCENETKSEATFEWKEGDLEYRLNTEEILLEGNTATVYGVTLVQKEDNDTTQIAIPNITANKADMIQMIEIMRAGQVSAVTLKDVIDDFLA